MIDHRVAQAWLALWGGLDGGQLATTVNAACNNHDICFETLDVDEETCNDALSNDINAFCNAAFQPQGNPFQYAYNAARLADCLNAGSGIAAFVECVLRS